MGPMDADPNSPSSGEGHLHLPWEPLDENLAFARHQWLPKEEDAELHGPRDLPDVLRDLVEAHDHIDPECWETAPVPLPLAAAPSVVPKRSLSPPRHELALCSSFGGDSDSSDDSDGPAWGWGPRMDCSANGPREPEETRPVVPAAPTRPSPGRAQSADTWVERSQRLQKELQLAKALASRHVPDKQLFQEVLEACMSAGDGAAARQWVLKSLQVGFPPDPAMYAKVNNLPLPSPRSKASTEQRLARLCTGHLVQEEMEEMVVENLREGNVGEAEKWLGLMMAEGFWPPEMLLEGVIQTLAATGEIVRAVQWLRKMLELGFKPDEEGLEAMLIAASCAAPVKVSDEWGDHPPVAQLTFAMLEMGLRLGPTTCSFILDSCLKAGATCSARWVLEMTGAPVHLWAKLIRACGKAADLNVAEECMHRLQAHGPFPDQSCFAALVTAFVMSRQEVQAECWLAKMVAAGFKVDQRLLDDLSRLWRSLKMEAKDTFWRSTLQVEPEKEESVSGASLDPSEQSSRGSKPASSIPRAQPSRRVCLQLDELVPRSLGRVSS